MYLSRLILNPRSRQVQRETADPYQLHRTLLQAFGPNRDQSQVLHRLDIHPHTGLPVLLVQSQGQPDWTRLPNPNYLLPADPFDPTPNPAVKTFDLPLRPGQVLQFRLCANPTIKKIRRDDQGEFRHSNRVPLVHEDQQIEWLAKQAEANGFRLLGVAISQPHKQTGWQKGNGRPITLYTVQYNGRLQVTDPDKLITAVQHGIGPAKAFGCGLLSLAPG